LEFRFNYRQDDVLPVKTRTKNGIGKNISPRYLTLVFYQLKEGEFTAPPPPPPQDTPAINRSLAKKASDERKTWN
jgi:hypothetical protein